MFVWHDILYNGPRKPGWPDEVTLNARANFLKVSTKGGLSKRYVLETLKTQYAKLKTASNHSNLVLWFDACLFDQSMLCHILACIRFLENEKDMGIAHTSRATAQRELADLVQKMILVRLPGGGRNASYDLNWSKFEKQTFFFQQIKGKYANPNTWTKTIYNQKHYF